MKSPLSHVKKLLVVLPSWIGDMVMCTPSLRALRRDLPETCIECVGKPVLEPLIAGLPSVDAFHAHTMKGWLGPFTHASHFRKMKFDGVLLLPNSPRSALFALATGAHTRIGWARDGRGWMLSHGLPQSKGGRPVSAVDAYADLVAWATQTPVTDRTVQLTCTPEQLVAGEKLLAGLARPISIFNPGANRADKRWSAEHFGSLAKRLLTAHNGTVAVTGSPSEAEVVAGVVKASGQTAINLMDRGVSLESLKGAIRLADLVVTNDTGPRHLAAGLGTRCVCLFGPTDPRWTLLHEPAGSIREIHVVAEPFLPAQLVADRLGSYCGMDRISVGDVTHACLQLLQLPR